jgi:hypothetical protein
MEGLLWVFFFVAFAGCGFVLVHVNDEEETD